MRLVQPSTWNLFGLISAVLCFLNGGICFAAQQSDATVTPPRKKSVLRFTTDAFFGGAYVDVAGLKQDTDFQNLRLDLFSLTDIFLDRFDPKVVQEFALLIGEGSKKKTAINRDAFLNKAADFELAAVVKLASPMPLEDVYFAWQSLANKPVTFDEANIQRVNLGGTDCWRCPSGTFLRDRHQRGKIRWFSANGQQRAEGISIGSQSNRRYIAGGSKSAAVVRFELSPKQIAADKLRLKINPHIFRTTPVGLNQAHVASFFIQKPGRTEIRSEPVAVTLESYVDSTITLKSFSASSERSGLAQYLTDGQIEAVVTIDDEHEGTYLGFSEADFTLVGHEAEYVWVDDDTMVIAQSQVRLLEMIQAAKERETNLVGKGLQRVNEHLAKVFVDLRNRRQLTSWNRFLDEIGVATKVLQCFDWPCRFEGGILDDSELLATANLQFDVPIDRELKETLSVMLEAAEANATTGLIEFSRRYTNLGQLANIAMQLNASGHCREWPNELLSGEGDQREFYERTMMSVVESLFDQVTLDFRTKGELNLSLRKPDWTSRATSRQHYALQMIALARAMECQGLEKFWLHQHLLKNVLAEVPEEKWLWKRIAHQLTYKVAAQFPHGEDHPYPWVREGILLLLDGYESDPQTIDLLHTAANFIGNKIGASEQRWNLRKSFAHDHQLHQRLAQYVDVDLLKSSDAGVDNWLVAEALMRYCLDQIEEGKQCSTPRSQTDEFLAYSRVRFASLHDEEGHFSGRKQRWKDAEVTTRSFHDGGIQTLADLEGDLEAGPGEVYRLMPNYTNAATRLAKCQLQQLEWVEPLHRKAYQAVGLEAAGDFAGALSIHQELADATIARFKASGQLFEELKCSDVVDSPQVLYWLLFGSSAPRYRSVLRRMKISPPDRHQELLKRGF